MPRTKRLLGGNYRVEYEDGTVYVGEMQYGKVTGVGSMIYADGSTYDGGFDDGRRHGYGRAKLRSGNSEYEGYWRYDKRHGHGKETFFKEDGSVSSIFEGEFENDVRKGPGVNTWPAQDCELSGDFNGHYVVGKATMRYADGSVYRGLLDIYNGSYCKTGYGVLTTAGGVKSYGSFKNDKRHGRFKISYPDREETEYYIEGKKVSAGEFERRFVPEEGNAALPSGKDSAEGSGDRGGAKGSSCAGAKNSAGQQSRTGTIRYGDGAVYVGEVKSGEPNGEGRIEYADGHVYEGHFKNGDWDGYGKATFPDSREIFEGYWRNNRRWGHGKASYCDDSWNVRNVFEGEYEDDVQNGPGTNSWPIEGSELKGTFRGWETVGTAEMRYNDGGVYRGVLKIIDNSYSKEGLGTYTSPEGVSYTGRYKGDMMDGSFTVVYPDGSKAIEHYSGGRKIGEEAAEDDGSAKGFTGKDKSSGKDASAKKGSSVKKDPSGRDPSAKKGSSGNGKKAPENEELSPYVLRLDPSDERFLHVQYDGNGKYAAELQPYFADVIGMESVKDQLDKLYKRFRIDSMRQKTLGLKQSKQGYYFIITGSPGTGKTTVARIIGRMLCDMGILPEETLVEVDRSKLVGEYIGQTAKLTSAAIESARGGTLFIDEAYSLFKKGDAKDFGSEAIDTLLKDMEDHRGEYCVIMAGYADEMNEMMRLANPGLASRFDHKVTIGDYSADELTDILVSMAASKHFLIKKEARPVILAMIEREKIDETFDNARYARRLLDEAIERQAMRLSEMSGELGAEQLQVLEADDFGKPQSDVSTLDSCMAQLNELTGIEGVKSEIQSFVRGVRIQNESRKRGLSISSAPAQINMVFTGNPGTGKTTVARLLSRIYYHLGLLKRPDVFVECVRADLVGRYQGETAIKVKEVVHRALGGILFIDEAYSLVMGENDSFGIEAVNTLVSEIENNRENLAVILAGYTKEMSEFLDSNPGLRSRLPRVVEFEDYTPAQLAEIFRKELAKRGYEVKVSDEKLVPLIEESMKAKDFGNARGVRNLCDKVVEKHNERINESDLSELSDADFITIADEDL